VRLFHPELEKITEKICKCGKVFGDTPYIMKKRKYCSKKCYHKYNIPWNKNKQFCPKRHDTFIVGREKDHTCSQCNKDYKVRWSKMNRVRRSKLVKQSIWKSKGILNSAGNIFTLEDFDDLYRQQKGKCLICKKHQSEFKVALSVDHNHETGFVRGLLCRSCNSILGMIDENVEILGRMIKHLENKLK
jgi:hypothetical protein